MAKYGSARRIAQRALAQEKEAQKAAMDARMEALEPDTGPELEAFMDPKDAPPGIEGEDPPGPDIAAGLGEADEASADRLGDMLASKRLARQGYARGIVGEPGSITFEGDPFTYEQVGNDYRVASVDLSKIRDFSPEQAKGAVGAMITEAKDSTKDPANPGPWDKLSGMPAPEPAGEEEAPTASPEGPGTPMYSEASPEVSETSDVGETEELPDVIPADGEWTPPNREGWQQDYFPAFIRKNSPWATPEDREAKRHGGDYAAALAARREAEAGAAPEADVAPEPQVSEVPLEPEVPEPDAAEAPAEPEPAKSELLPAHERLNQQLRASQHYAAKRTRPSTYEVVDERMDDPDTGTSESKLSPDQQRLAAAEPEASEGPAPPIVFEEPLEIKPRTEPKRSPTQQRDDAAERAMRISDRESAWRAGELGEGTLSGHSEVDSALQDTGLKAATDPSGGIQLSGTTTQASMERVLRDLFATGVLNDLDMSGVKILSDTAWEDWQQEHGRKPPNSSTPRAERRLVSRASRSGGASYEGN